MAAPRKPRAGRTPRAPRVAGTRETTTGAVGGGELGDAAEEIADGAREMAAWSRQISSSINVDVAGDVATVWTDAPPAYPAETRARHPLFGDREHWYGPPGAPFLGPAADARATPAMAKYAKKIDRMVRESGLVK